MRFHGTRHPQKIAALNPFTHFGTIDAALHFASRQKTGVGAHLADETDGQFFGTVYGYDGEPRNALRTSDPKGNRISGIHSSVMIELCDHVFKDHPTHQALVDELRDCRPAGVARKAWRSAGRPTSGAIYEELRFEEEPCEERLEGILARLGYDAITYVNENEDRGHESFCFSARITPLLCFDIEDGMTYDEAKSALTEIQRQHSR